MAVALTAHAGIEWDLEEAAADELEWISAWASLYREVRGLVHSGNVINADVADDGVILSGIVAPDGSRGIFTWARLASSAAGQSGRVRFPGLDPTASYRLRVRNEIGVARRHEATDPSWVESASTPDGILLHGAVLTVVGVPLPTLNPEQAMVFDIVRSS
jgi:alpha-galactosidase